MTQHDNPFNAPAPENPPAVPGMRDEHGHDAHRPDAHTHGHDDHGGTAKYVKVFLALCVLTTLSFFTYSEYWWFKETPAVGWAFMMCVSCCKALLVLLFFMHLKWEADWKYVLTIPASIMSIFLGLALIPDVGLRVNGMYPYSPVRNRYAATTADAEALIKASEAEAAKQHAAESAAPR
jgi:cytochrome c oxidase subunit IV